MTRHKEGLEPRAEILCDSLSYETLLGQARGRWDALPPSLQERIPQEVRISRVPERGNEADLSHGTPAANLISPKGWRRIKDKNPATTDDFKRALQTSSGRVDRGDREEGGGTTFNLHFFGVLPTAFAAIRGELDDTYLLTLAF